MKLVGPCGFVTPNYAAVALDSGSGVTDLVRCSLNISEQLLDLAELIRLLNIGKEAQSVEQILYVRLPVCAGDDHFHLWYETLQFDQNLAARPPR